MENNRNIALVTVLDLFMDSVASVSKVRIALMQMIAKELEPMNPTVPIEIEPSDDLPFDLLRKGGNEWPEVRYIDGESWVPLGDLLDLQLAEVGIKLLQTYEH